MPLAVDIGRRRGNVATPGSTREGTTLTNATDTTTAPSAQTTHECPACGRSVDPGWRFCSHCGATVRPEDFSPGATSKATSSNGDEFIPVPEARPDWASIGPSRRRRRRKRKPLYRRPLVMVPTLLLLLLTGAMGYTLYRTDSLMSTMRQISTPPPVITDNTFVEEGDPDAPSEPISVETGPALAALEEAGPERDLPQADEGGITGDIADIASNFQDFAGGASVASGLKDTSDMGFTMLVMGVDARPGEPIDIGVRPDAFMVIHFDPVDHTCRSLSIPRDTRVQLPGYGMSKINHALMVGGIPYQILVTEDFLGIEIDHYLLIDFVAFSELVDAVGGVSVEIPRDLEKDGELRYEAGTHEFDGEEALKYARFRTFSDDGDPDRVKRQWSILSGLADKAENRNLVRDVNTLVPTVEEHIRTDLTMTEMATIAKHFGNSCVTGDGAEIDILESKRVRLHDPILNRTEYFQDVPRAKVREAVEQLLGAPQDDKKTTAGGA